MAIVVVVSKLALVGYESVGSLRFLIEDQLLKVILKVIFSLLEIVCTRRSGHTCRVRRDSTVYKFVQYFQLLGKSNEIPSVAFSSLIKGCTALIRK